MRYVAIGDSFTEGVGDPRPDGSLRGWADLVAEGLRTALAAQDQPVDYANLAIRGRLLAPIIAEQLPAALALRPAPDLLTLNGGGNDMLRPGVHLDDLLRLTEQAITQCQAAEVRIVVLSGADPTAQLPLGRLVRRRGTYLTAGLRELCEKYEVTLVNVFADAEIRRRHYWSADRLHLNELGHQRVAGLVLHALGYADLPAAAAAVADDKSISRSGYYRTHVLPWVIRRLRGRSSGDNVTAKHPMWNRLQAEAPAQD